MMGAPSQITAAKKPTTALARIQVLDVVGSVVMTMGAAGA
jgi:hypothetical protein